MCRHLSEEGICLQDKETLVFWQEDMMKTEINWPDGKRFAFTVFDDTDLTTLENGPEVYRFLSHLGILTTKSVWAIKGGQIPRVGGTTCEDADYLAWVLALKQEGFEIAMHNASYHTLQREEIIRGLEQFKTYFGVYPNIHANHSGCDDGVYWGDARLSGLHKSLYNVLTRFKNSGKFQGALESSPLFWGDHLKEKVKYVRNFVFRDINTLKSCPYMPYIDPTKPFVNYWFASSEGATCSTFCKTLSEENQDRLEKEGGACIMYTHFGAGFYQAGRLDPEFKRLMTRLSKKNGWFVPVSVLLDYLNKTKGVHTLTAKERRILERKWLFEKIFITRGTT